MPSEEKNYEQSALGKRVNELMDDGYDFGEAVKQAMSEGLKDGGSVGIEILFGPKRDNFRYGGDTMGGRNDRSRSSPGPDRSRVSAQQQSNHDRAMAAAQNDGPSFKDKVKSIITNPATQSLGGAILTGGMNLALPGALDKLNKARMIKNAIDYARYVAPDEAIEGELENIQTQGGIVPYADGGRVGLFMGGSPLEGEALSIYNSMKAYGNDDQAIADALAAQGLYTPGSTPVVEEPVTNIAPNIINQGGGDSGPQGIATVPGTYGKEYTGMTMPDGTPIGSMIEMEGPGIIDSLKNTAGNLFGLYQKFSPIGIISKFMKDRATQQQTLQNNALAKAEAERKAKEAIAKAEAEAIARENFKEAMRQGQGFYDSLNEGRGASVSQESREQAGSGYGDVSESGPFKDGGLATMLTRKR